MTTLARMIPFDRSGVIGPAASLLSLWPTYNSKQLSLVIKILQENAEKVAKTSLHGRKELVKLMSANKKELSIKQILETRLFQDLQIATPLPSTYKKVEQFIAPKTLAQTQSEIPAFKQIWSNEENIQELTVWMARVLSNYMTPEQIENECKFLKLVAQKPDIREKRLEVGGKIYAAAENKNLTKTGFDCFIGCLRERLENEPDCKKFKNPTEETILSLPKRTKEDDAYEICSHIDNYLTLFAMAEVDSQWFGPHICSMLEKIFKEKFFPDSQGSKLIPIDPRSGTGAVLALLYRANSYTLEELSEVTRSAKRNYTFLSGQEIHGRKAFWHMFDKAKEEGRTISINEILSSQMFQEMRPKEINSQSHELAEKGLAPAYIKIAEYYMPEICNVNFTEDEVSQITECLAYLLESFMTKEDIENECKIKEFERQHPQVAQKRGSIGKKLYDAALNSRLTESAFNIFVNTLDTALKENDLKKIKEWSNGSLIEGLPESDETVIIEKYIREYASLFAMAEDDAIWVGKHVVRMVSKYFRSMFFPGSEPEDV